MGGHGTAQLASLRLEPARPAYDDGLDQGLAELVAATAQDDGVRIETDRDGNRIA